MLKPKYDPLIFAIVFSGVVLCLVYFAIKEVINQKRHEEHKMKLRRKLEKELIRWEVGSHSLPEILTVSPDGDGLVVGIGHDVTANDKLELDDEITVDEMNTFFKVDVTASLDAMTGVLAKYQDHPDEVHLVVSAMCFQMGRRGVLKFKKMVQAIDDCNYGKAADEMLDSLWAKQTPVRAKRMASLMRLAIPSSPGGG